MSVFGFDESKSLIEVLAKEDIQTVVGNLMYPVGSIYMSINNINPTSLFGGKWVSWGAGRVPVGVNANDTNFNAVEKTGGSKTHNHTSASHTHTVPSHTHTSASHTHTIAGHTHTTAGHVLTIAEIPSHNHKDIRLAENHLTAWNSGTNSSGFKLDGLFEMDSITGSGQQFNTGHTGGGQAHSHGNTGSTALTTNATTPAKTGGTALTTNATTPPNTGDSSTLQPYVTCYMWKRVS